MSMDIIHEQELSLSDRLKGFKNSQFDHDSFLGSKCPNMTEKEIRHLCVFLKDLKKASAEEMRKSVYANYAAFIRTAKEISALESQLTSLRNLLSAQAKVVHSLSDQARLNSVAMLSQVSSNDDSSNSQNQELARVSIWLSEFLETMEVLLAEKRVDEALDTLDKAELKAEEAVAQKKLAPKILLALQNTVKGQRIKLGDLVVDMASQRSTRGSDLKKAIMALKRLGDGPRAHTLLLKVHHLRLHLNVQNLRPFGSTRGGTGGSSFCSSASQMVFSTIAQASKDSLVIFGEHNTYISELVTWAVKETENLAVLCKRNTLALAAGTGNLRVAADVVRVCLGHCALLEARGLALSPVLLRRYKSLVDQSLSNNMSRIERTCANLAADEDWSLSSTQPRLSRSAQKFHSMIQELFDDVETLETLQLTNATLEGVNLVFTSFVITMTSALPAASVSEGNHDGAVIVKTAETEIQQLTLLANALLLADELIPRAASRAFARSEDPTKRGEKQPRLPEQRDWKKRLQRAVDSLRDSFCRQHALELIFTPEGDVLLNGQMYTALDTCVHEPEWFPSGIFQELYGKLTQIAGIATDMFAGKERFTTTLLMRLTETVILWLSEDQTFWEEIEQGPNRLGPLGLQQFYLDMQFVLVFASQGRYLSRSLPQVAKNVMARAIEAVTATGVDPYNSLPDDGWFTEVAQMALKMLTNSMDDGEGEAVSPTASVSVSERSADPY